MSPLCSIGMPIYNRLDSFKIAIREIQDQSYRNLEIIISNNASPDHRIDKLCKEVAADDSRIKYFRQNYNVGPRANFEFVLNNSSGKYFMWAADDDRRSLDYVNCLIQAHESQFHDASLIAMEAQFTSPDGVFPFFSEGEPFYSFSSTDRVPRIRHILNNGYGNIIYGLYKRDRLFKDGTPLIQHFGESLSEMPFFVTLAGTGNIHVLPEIGLHKYSPLHVCQYAKWIIQGGKSPAGPRVSNPKRLYRYNRMLLQELIAALDSLDLDKSEATELAECARQLVRKHVFFTGIGWKPRRSIEE